MSDARDANSSKRDALDDRRLSRWAFVAIALVGAFVLVVVDVWWPGIGLVVAAFALAIWALQS